MAARRSRRRRGAPLPLRRLVRRHGPGVALALGACLSAALVWLLPETLRPLGPLGRTAAASLPAIAPLPIGLGALVAALLVLRRMRDDARFARVRSTESLRALSWQEFESLVGARYRALGYRVAPNDGPGADGGVDLVLHGAEGTIIVQCKHYRGSVGVPVVRELLGTVTACGAAAGIVATSGTFTRDARAFADGVSNVSLVDAPLLLGTS